MSRVRGGEPGGSVGLRIDPGGRAVELNEAGGGQEIITRSGVDDRGTALRMDQEGVDAGSPRRPEGILKDPMRLFEIDIAHHVKASVQIAVADRRDDDISDLAIIDAGNLLGGLRSHAGRPRSDLGMGRLDQAPVSLRKASTQSKIKSGVCTAI